MLYGGPESALTQYGSEQDFAKSAIGRATEGVRNVFKTVTDRQRKKGTFEGGLRAANSGTTQSRMSLPLSDVAKSGVQPLGTATKPSQVAKPEPSDLDRLKGAYDTDYKYRGLYGNQDIDLTKRKIKEVDFLANNEANRAYEMKLAAELPYQTFQKSADLFGGARTLASVMGTFDTLRYQKGVSMSL